MKAVKGLFGDEDDEALIVVCVIFWFELDVMFPVLEDNIVWLV